MTTARQLLSPFFLFFFVFSSLFSLASSCLRQQPQALLFATASHQPQSVAMARPTGLIATKGIELLTWGKQASRSRTSSRFCAALFFFLFLLAASASAHHIYHIHLYIAHCTAIYICIYRLYHHVFIPSSPSLSSLSAIQGDRKLLPCSTPWP